MQAEQVGALPTAGSAPDLYTLHRRATRKMGNGFFCNQQRCVDAEEKKLKEFSPTCRRPVKCKAVCHERDSLTFFTYNCHIDH